MILLPDFPKLNTGSQRFPHRLWYSTYERRWLILITLSGHGNQSLRVQSVMKHACFFSASHDTKTPNPASGIASHVS